MLEGRDQEAAAAAAARLKAFLANPAERAPYYQQGIEPLPEGGFVLRFAQGKFPAPMSRGLAPAEAQALREAAGEFVRRVCLWERADHYQVLCARREAPGETLRENYHLLMALLHPDRQEAGDDAWPQACAQRVNLAYAALGDEAARREYDARMRQERPRSHAPAGIDVGKDRRQAKEVRFAKSLIAVSGVVAALMVTALSVEDDDWGDRSVLQASLARLRANPVAGADRPRYVGASSQRASDALPEEPEPFAIFRPLMRALVAEEPKAWAPMPKLEAAAPAPAAPAPAAPTPVVATAPVALPVAVAEPPVAVTAEPARPPLKMAQAPSAVTPPPKTANIAPRATGDGARPTNLEIESLVVALIGYYEAGDADHLMGLVDGGFWRTAQMRQSYSDFFRATRARRLRLERLAWNTESGAAKARGEATVIAEYFDRNGPVERRVDVELDIGVRDGQARITRLSLFPGSR